MLRFLPLHLNFTMNMADNFHTAGFCVGDVSHQGAGLPDQQGVREVQQVPAQCKGRIHLNLHSKGPKISCSVAGYFYTFAR